MARVVVYEPDPLRKVDPIITYTLLPCPFCGRDMARFITCHEVEACGQFNRCDRDGSFAVICSFVYGGCGSSSGFYESRAEAAEAWNKRSEGEADGT